MKQISFCKFQGFGNDYLVLENTDLPLDLEEFAKRICDRHFGVGADGISVLEPPSASNANYKCRIFNPDGSQATFSGNGTRAAVAYLYFKNYWQQPTLLLETLSGIKSFQILKQDGKTFWFKTILGKPSQIQKLNLDILGQPLKVDFIEVGNPVCVIFSERFDIPWKKIGEQIEYHPMFPSRTNVVFVKPVNENEIEIRIWERGVGETSSSGTCSIAAAVSYLNNHNRRGEIAVKAVGGTTIASWDDDDLMCITGKVDLVFCGVFFD